MRSTISRTYAKIVGRRLTCTLPTRHSTAIALCRFVILASDAPNRKIRQRSIIYHKSYWITTRPPKFKSRHIDRLLHAFSLWVPATANCPAQISRPTISTLRLYAFSVSYHSHVLRGRVKVTESTSRDFCTLSLARVDGNKYFSFIILPKVALPYDFHFLHAARICDWGDESYFLKSNAL